MTESGRIRDQLKRSYKGQAWHGPSVRELLEGVTAEQAAKHPIGGAHSIWELVLHIIAWERVGRQRIIDWKAESVPDEEDWSQVTDTSETAWNAILEELERTTNALAETI